MKGERRNTLRRQEGSREQAPPRIVRRSAQRPTRKPSRGVRHVGTPAEAGVRLVHVLIGLAALVLIGLGLWFGLPNLPNMFAGVEPRSVQFIKADSAIPELPPLPALDNPSIVHKVVRGETLSAIFEKYGLPPGDADTINKSLRGLKGVEVPTSIRPGQILEFIFSDSGDLAEMRSPLPKGSVLSIMRGPDQSYHVELHTLAKENKEHLALGVIDTSFAAAAAKAGMPYDVVDEMVDLFSNRVSFHRDFRKGDRFTLIYHAEVLEDGTQVGSGPILAAALDVDGDQMAVVRYIGTDGKARYFDQSGELIGNTFLRYPVKFSRISSQFSRSRFHPVLRRRRPHNGVDFAAATGTPVRTVADGVVTFSGRKGGAGKMIKIRHSDRYSTAYLHLSRIGKGIRKGARVKRGELIGAVGKTGLATGPHLHFSFYDRGKYVDPLKIKLPTVESLTKGKKIDSSYLKKVLLTLRHYQTVDLGQFYAAKSE